MEGSDTETRDHWWWRPGWRTGRSFYTWHILVDDQEAIHKFAARVQPELEATGALGAIPFQWLHMTMQGVGFSDEVAEAEVAAVAAAVERRLAVVQPVAATVGPLVADAEGVNLPVRPVGPVDGVRRAIREGIADVWGPDRVPEDAEGYRPHVSLAYSNVSGRALAPIREVIARYDEVIPVTLTRATLIDVNRDDQVYRWRIIHTAAFADGSPG
ncbi:2'-5' RNA ligase family protein [Nonomuraea sp. LPB2021202275-12-8]|uniref:2'-5' RNA ligase family protein n=1 Tax=Nonomuraea sp. LPB2021202275-12-8 TaxID=3120159 RepID=UPI00300C0418